MHILISRATTKKISQNYIVKKINRINCYNINIYLIQNKAGKKLQGNKKKEQGKLTTNIEMVVVYSTM